LFYDLAGRLTRRKFADGREVVYGYDAAGNLTSLAPPGRSAHIFTYTVLDQAESYTPPDVGVPTVTRYRYNLDRQLTHILRPGGDSIVFVYDSAGRPSAINFDRGLLIFGYHPTTGKLQTITAPGGNVLSYNYDGSLPHSETWSGEVSGSVSVAYNNDFRVSRQLVNGTGAIAFTYDTDGLLIRAGELAIQRRPENGLVSGTTLGSLSTEQGYNVFGELGHLSARFDGSELYRAEYTRDQLGRITALTETVQGVTSSLTFVYDEAGRLKEVTRDGVVVEAYDYDANGNRLRATYPTGTLVGAYDAQDRLISYGGVSYTFAPSGELALKVQGPDTTRYTYDQLGNLVRVELSDGRVIEYVIDGRNRRVGRKVDGVLTHGWLYQDQLNPVVELDASGNVVSRFVYGTRANVPDYMVRDGRTYRIITDHLGSVRLVVDVMTGAVVQRLDYDAYGRVLLDTNPGFQPFGFAGGIYDPETGLVRFGARDYDPHTGRWTSKDPIGFAGGDPNLYGYVLGDPVNYIDRDGLEVDFAGYTLRNPQVILNLLRLNEAIMRVSGLRNDQFMLRVTGGDRFRDENGVIVSATNGLPILKSAAKSPHLVERGARAVDLAVVGVSDCIFDRALKSTDFLPANTIRGYDDGHIHIALPNIEKFYAPTFDIPVPDISMPVF